MKLFFRPIFFLFLINQSIAQTFSPIQLDRPDQTECPFITPKKYIQIENGFTIENVAKNMQSITYPSTLWKYGINEKLELRLITELVTEKQLGTKIAGLLPITIGFKTALFEENGLIPKTSFIGHITSANISSKKFSTTHIAPSFRFVMQHTLSPKVSFAYNLGSEWNGENAQNLFIYTVTTGISLSNKLGYYFELYGYLANKFTADNRMDSGFTYLLNNDFMFDISGGLGLTNNSIKNYISLGFSYRFKTVH